MNRASTVGMTVHYIMLMLQLLLVVAVRFLVLRGSLGSGLQVASLQSVAMHRCMPLFTYLRMYYLGTYVLSTIS